MDNAGHLHRYIYLYQSDSQLAFAATTSGSALIIDRATAKVSLQVLNTSSFPASQTVYGILGTIRLRLDTYVIVVTGRESVGHLASHEIWRLTKFEIIPLRLAKGQAIQDVDEAGFINLITLHFSTNPFYFSYTYNLTNSVQRNASQASQPGQPFWQLSDDRFFWNRYLQSSLIDFRMQNPVNADVDAYILPIIFGFLHVQHTFANHKALTVALISRRSRHRVGTRFFSRGIDANGNVSNFNETEQLLLIPSIAGQKWMSYVQTRGSIPVFWAEVMDLKYKPKLRIFGQIDKAVDPARKHFEQQVAVYGDVILVNLVNQSGHEKPVKLAFEEVINKLGMSRIKYVYFDFHAECSKMRWDRISVLIDRLKGDLAKQQYTVLEGDKLVKEQTSVIRTNCMDCLDRTNVVQSALARTVITRQLIDCGIFKETDRVDMFPDFENMFRNIWADNADVVSKAYSGTGALKTDFTRTGKRSIAGLLQDGQNSVERYIKNNFFDISRQDAFDLILGNYAPWEMLSQSQIFMDHRPLFIQAVPYIFYASVIMILAAFVLPRADNARLPLNAFLAFWLAVFIWSIYFIFANGRIYVQWPRLVPLEFAPDVSGHKRDHMASLEKGEGRGHKREVSVAPPKGPAGILGTLFGRWAPGRGGGEDVELVGVGKDGRAHAE